MLSQAVNDHQKIEAKAAQYRELKKRLLQNDPNPLQNLPEVNLPEQLTPIQIKEFFEVHKNRSKSTFTKIPTFKTTVPEMHPCYLRLDLVTLKSISTNENVLLAFFLEDLIKKTNVPAALETISIGGAQIKQTTFSFPMKLPHIGKIKTWTKLDTNDKIAYNIKNYTQVVGTPITTFKQKDIPQENDPPLIKIPNIRIFKFYDGQINKFEITIDETTHYALSKSPDARDDIAKHFLSENRLTIKPTLGKQEFDITNPVTKTIGLITTEKELELTAYKETYLQVVARSNDEFYTEIEFRKDVSGTLQLEINFDIDYILRSKMVEENKQTELQKLLIIQFPKFKNLKYMKNTCYHRCETIYINV